MHTSLEPIEPKLNGFQIHIQRQDKVNIMRYHIQNNYNNTVYFLKNLSNQSLASFTISDVIWWPIPGCAINCMSRKCTKRIIKGDIHKEKWKKKCTATAKSVNSTDKNTLLVNPPHINVYLVKYERERKTDHLIVLLQRTFNKEFPMKWILIVFPLQRVSMKFK